MKLKITTHYLFILIIKYFYNMVNCYNIIWFKRINNNNISQSSSLKNHSQI